jgi:esterase
MKLINFSDKGNGKCIVLIHGLFGSMDNLNMVARKLIDNYRVINIDVRNHGYSFQTNSMHYEELALDIITLLDYLAIEHTAILGHSMGGKIAMQTALDYPGRIDKLIVADIAPVAYPAHHTQIIEGLLAINLAEIRSRKQADEQLAQYVDDHGVRQFLLRNLVKNGEQFTFKCHLNYIKNCYPQIMQGYTGNGQFSGKTLFLKGGNSDYLKPEHQTFIKQLFPNSQAKIINGAGHWLHAEKSVVFNRIVNDFLSEN